MYTCIVIDINGKYTLICVQSDRILFVPNYSNMFLAHTYSTLYYLYYTALCTYLCRQLYINYVLASNHCCRCTVLNTYKYIIHIIYIYIFIYMCPTSYIECTIIKWCANKKKIENHWTVFLDSERSGFKFWFQNVYKLKMCQCKNC